MTWLVVPRFGVETDRIAQHAYRKGLVHIAASAALGWLAWSWNAVPALILLMPLVCMSAPRRWVAWASWTVYQLVATRYHIEYASDWYESGWLGVPIWLSFGVMGGLVWGMCWSAKGTPTTQAARALLALAVLTVTPLAVFVYGSPLVGVGFLLPGWGWVGLALYALAVASLIFKLHNSGISQSQPLLLVAIGGFLSVLVFATGETPDLSSRQRGKVVGEYAALNTRLGGYPLTPDDQVTRIETLASVLKTLTDGSNQHDGVKLAVLPEAVLGLDSDGLHYVIRSEWLPILRAGGISVIYGVDRPLARGRFANNAVLLRPDGSTSSVSAKQTPPVAQWAPWSEGLHFPAGWMNRSVLEVAPGIRARVMLCFEELIPMLHLISEATEDHQFVIAMANHWPKGGKMVGHFQSLHTEGMARLFRRPWIRSQNSSAEWLSIQQESKREP
jgi:hypothetical protein